MSEIQIIAAIEVKPDDREALLSVMQNVVLESRLEAGCIRYDLMEELSNPLSLCVVETWASQAALDAHGATSHFDRLVQFLNSHHAKVDNKFFRQVL